MSPPVNKRDSPSMLSRLNTATGSRPASSRNRTSTCTRRGLLPLWQRTGEIPQRPQSLLPKFLPNHFPLKNCAPFPHTSKNSDIFLPSHFSHLLPFRHPLPAAFPPWFPHFPQTVQLAQTIHSILRLSTLSTLIHQNYVESCPPRKMPISRYFAVIHQVIHIIHRFFPPHRWILHSLYICFIFVNIS